MLEPKIIAEIGTNHNGNFDTAIKLIDVAVNANADSVKLQIINTEGLYLPGIYEFGNYDIREVRAMRDRYKLLDSEYQNLATYSITKNISFSASVFDLKGLALLMEFNPPYIKIASTDLNNISFLRKVAEKGKKIIISTGMSELSEIENTINEITKTGFSDLVLMHCVSAYPAKLENMNLGFIDTLRTQFGFPVALSDHTQSSIAACLALTKEVVFIEKHITLDVNQHGFDHKYAAEPEVFKQYIYDIKRAYQALQEPTSKLAEDEQYVKKRARRSIYAARDILIDEIIHEKDLLIVRPSNILTADKCDLVIGKKAKTKIQQFQPLSLELIY
ncbi:MAG: N-acetylneuraminate synthase family protein [Bacteroidetes bacterium]|nr:N-acetylneuraminate synthase family protein [Bacteroidota bacterium]